MKLWEKYNKNALILNVPSFPQAKRIGPESVRDGQAGMTFSG
jgi:predicted DNA-binding transcriptional regulator AlpA